MAKLTPKKQSFSSGGILFNKKGQIALVEMDGDAWSFPKGHKNLGETDLDAAKRELSEETGIESFELIKKLGTYQRPNKDNPNEVKNITLYLFKTSEINLSPDVKDITKAIWVNKNKVTSILSLDEDKAFFESISDKLPDILV